MSTTSRNDLVLIRITTAASARPIRFTGVVEAVGADVIGIAPGDVVSGSAERVFVFGQYACIPQRQIETTGKGE